MFTINLSKIKDDPVPDGLYHAKIAAAALAVTADGDPKLDIRLLIDSGDQAGRVLFDTIVLSHDPTSFSMLKLKQLILSTGVVGDPNTNEDLNIDPEIFIGETVTIRVKMGKQGTKVDPSTGQPYPPRPFVNQYQPYGNAPDLDNLLDGEE